MSTEPTDVVEEEPELSEEEQFELDEEAAFLAGAAGDEEDTTPLADDVPEEEPEPEPEPAEAVAEDPAPEPDPEPDPMEKRVRQMEGRYGELNNTIKELKDVISGAANDTKESGAAAPTKEQTREAMQDGEKLKELIEQFPEFGEAIQESIGMLNTTLDSRLPDVENLGQTVQDQVMLEVNRILVDRDIDSAHKGWKNITQSEEFSNWYTIQGPDILALGASDHAEDAIELLDKFKAHRDAPAPEDTSAQNNRRNQDKLKKAVSPTTGTRGKPAPDVQTEEEDFVTSFNNAR